MSGAAKARELLLPWAGLIASGCGWFAAHQIGANAAFDHCTAGTLLLIVVVGVVALLLAAGGAFLSVRVWRRPDETETRRFIAVVAAFVSALLALAIILQTLSALLLGSCSG